MGKIRIRELIARASKDFELAKRQRSSREYVSATLLYNSAVEKVLKALYISKSRREPPANASIGYLASRTGVPDEISVYINSVQEGAGINDPVDFVDLEQVEPRTSAGAERQAFYMDGLAKRLLDYVSVYTKN